MFQIVDQSFYLNLKGCFVDFDELPEKKANASDSTLSVEKYRSEKFSDNCFLGGCFSRPNRPSPIHSKYSVSQSCSDDPYGVNGPQRTNSISKNLLIKGSHGKNDYFHSIQEDLNGGSLTLPLKPNLEEQNRFIEEIKRLHLQTFQTYMAEYFKFLRMIFVSSAEDPKSNFKMLGLTKKFALDFVKQPLEPKIKYQVFKILSIWTEPMTSVPFGIQALNIE
jgi:hypothetical protein